MYVTDFSHSIKTNHARTARLLRANNITPTSQRVEIAEIVLRVSQHLSAEEIIAELREESSVSKATVYNTLKLFVEKGLIRLVNVHSERLIYDSNTKPHHHFFNVDTGELTDIDRDAIQISEMPAAPRGTQADGVEVVIKVRDAETS